jgi:hypothetical protein
VAADRFANVICQAIETDLFDSCYKINEILKEGLGIEKFEGNQKGIVHRRSPCSLQYHADSVKWPVDKKNGGIFWS